MLSCNSTYNHKTKIGYLSVIIMSPEFCTVVKTKKKHKTSKPKSGIPL